MVHSRKIISTILLAHSASYLELASGDTTRRYLTPSRIVQETTERHQLGLASASVGVVDNGLLRKLQSTKRGSSQKKKRSKWKVLRNVVLVIFGIFLLALPIIGIARSIIWSDHDDMDSDRPLYDEQELVSLKRSRILEEAGSDNKKNRSGGKQRSGRARQEKAGGAAPESSSRQAARSGGGQRIRESGQEVGRGRGRGRASGRGRVPGRGGRGRSTVRGGTPGRMAHPGRRVAQQSRGINPQSSSQANSSADNGLV